MHQSVNKSRIFMHVICVVCACLISCVSVFSSRSALPGTVKSDCYEDWTLVDEGTSVLDRVSLRAVHSSLDGLSVIFKEEADESETDGEATAEEGSSNEAETEEETEFVDLDPQLYLTFQDGDSMTLRTLEIVLEESFSSDVTCVLYYPSKSGKYSEKCSVVFTLPGGETNIFFELEETLDYPVSEVRIDIDENYTIVDVLVSDEEPVQEYELIEGNRVRSALLYFVVLLAVFETVLYCAPWVMHLAGVYLENCKKVNRMILILLGSAVVGNMGAYVVFLLAGKSYSWFWGVLISLCSMIVAYQICLLAQREPAGMSRKTCGTSNSVADSAILSRWTQIPWARVLFWGFVMVFCLLIAFEWLDGSVEAEGAVGNLIRFQFPFAFAVLETVLFALLFQKYVLNVQENRVSFINIYLFAFLVLGMAYLLVFLPYVSPDEPSHFVSAYRVANLLLGKIGLTEGDRLLMRTEDFALFDAHEEALSADYYMQITENFRLFASEQGYVVADGPMTTNAIFSYIIPGLGIAIARILHLSGTMTFLMGRLANLVFFAAVFYYLMKKIPFGRTALFAIMMMPMTIHMVASYSYDVTTFCFVALFVVQVMCMICSPEKVNRRDFRLCVVYGILVAPSKMVYIPLLLLVFLIPWEKLGDTRKEALKKQFAVVGISLGVMVVIMLIISLLSADSTLRKMAEQSASVNMLTWINEPGYTLSWVLGHLWEYIIMLARTVVDMMDYYFFTMIGSKLGWLDVDIPQIYAVASFVMLLLAINIRDERSEKVRVSSGQKAWIAFLCAGSMFATILVMTVSWTPMSYNYVVGVQGRYFIPLLIPAIWLFKTEFVSVKSVMRKYITFGAIMLNIWVLVYVFAQYIVAG